MSRQPSADSALSMADLSTDGSAFIDHDLNLSPDAGGEGGGGGKERDTRPRCPLTKRPIREPVICVIDGFTYERTAITDYVAMHSKAPVTQEPCSLNDLYSTKRVVEDALREGVADHEAAKMAQQLIKGRTPELANVPLHLRKLRKAAVAALHKFNTTEGIRKQEKAKKQKAEGDEDEEDEEVKTVQGENKAVGLVLASAINDLELELLTAQRMRRQQQAGEREALRDKRRRAETRRREHEERLKRAEARSSTSEAQVKELKQAVSALQSTLDAARATTDSLKRWVE